MKIPNLKLFNLMKEEIKLLSQTYFGIPCSWGRVYIVPDSGNCKACNLSNINSIYTDDDVQLVKKALINPYPNTDNEHIGMNKILFHCSSPSLRAIKLLSEEFHLIDITPVPIGYVDQCQYHCLFYIDNPNYTGNVTYKSRLKIAGLLNRKIEDFDINVTTWNKIKNTTEFSLEKARSYKRPSYLKKYLRKHGIKIE